MPNDYKYLSFINHTLIPKAKNWLDAVKDSEERYININLPPEAKRNFTDILMQLVDQS